MIKKTLYSFLFIIFFLSKSLYAQADREKTFVYHLIKFTNWDDDILKNGEPFYIGVFDSDDVSAAMSNFFIGKKCYNKTIEVKNLTNLKTIYNYDLIFLPEKNKDNSKAIIDLCNDYNILSISINNKGFCKKGGIINFVNTIEECIFQINNKVALENKIFFSPQLLNIAEIIN